MASSSSKENNNNAFCFQCQMKITTCINGWKLHSGSLAQLCDRCGSAYENGTFCETFHLEFDGWRNCVACNKMLHCGCIVSEKDILILDFGGVCCKDCAKKYQIWLKDALTSVNDVCRELWNALRTQCRDFHPHGEVCVGSEEPVKALGSGHGYFPLGSFPQTNVQLVMPGSAWKERTYESGASLNANSSSKTDTASEWNNLQKLLTRNEKEYLKLLGGSNSRITLLFNKLITCTDAEPFYGRLILPKRSAEEFLPKLYEPQGIILKVHDTAGKIWEFNYHFWKNNGGRMYILDGLHEYIVLWNWRRGDLVTFYRIEPEGKLVIVTTKW